MDLSPIEIAFCAAMETLCYPESVSEETVYDLTTENNFSEDYCDIIHDFCEEILNLLEANNYLPTQLFAEMYNPHEENTFNKAIKDIRHEFEETLSLVLDDSEDEGTEEYAEAQQQYAIGQTILTHYPLCRNDNAIIALYTKAQKGDEIIALHRATISQEVLQLK